MTTTIDERKKLKALIAYAATVRDVLVEFSEAVEKASDENREALRRTHVVAIRVADIMASHLRRYKKGDPEWSPAEAFDDVLLDLTTLLNQLYASSEPDSIVDYLMCDVPAKWYVQESIDILYNQSY